MNRFVLADSSHCIGCYACQAACVENHLRVGLQAYPRLIVTYTPAGTMPVQCRQCEQAPCALVCPVAAITLEHGSVVLNEAVCIGCKMCGLACPFGVMLTGGTPIPAYGFTTGQYSYTNHPYQSKPMHLREMDVHGYLSLLPWHIGQRKVAVKCDLCYFDEAGPACVRACPHKALSLLQDEGDGNRDSLTRIKRPPDAREPLRRLELLIRQGGD